MDKILVTVRVPRLEESFDFLIPIHKKIGNVLLALEKIVYDQSKEYFVREEAHHLYDIETGIILEPQKIVKEVGLRNGSVIILV